MSRIQVRGIEGIADLADDLQTIPATMRLRARAIVASNIEQGAIRTQGIARKAAGPHGKDYWKRIGSDMTGPLSGEFGPSAVQGTRFTGVSGSEGAMRDLEKAAAQQAPRFARDVERMVAGLFWPGG